MNYPRPKIRLLVLLIASVLAASAVQAGSPPTEGRPAPTAQQQAAREEIDRLTQRIEELSHQLGEGSDVQVIVHREMHDMHDMPFTTARSGRFASLTILWGALSSRAPFSFTSMKA